MKLLLLAAACGLGMADRIRLAAADAAPKAEQPAEARYITLTSPIDDVLTNWVRETGLELQHQADQEDRPAVLVLEVSPGNSQFHHVYNLANVLTSSAFSRVRTIAWVPETVVGNNVLAALACNEIVMHPDAQLGDIGRGKPVSDDERAIVLNMVAKRHNPKVNTGLATGMIDPQAAIIQLTIESADGTTEKRLVTKAEAEQLRDSDTVIKDSRTIKEPGQPGLFSGLQARNNDFLVMQTVESRHDLAAAYGLPEESLREQPQPDAFNKISLIEVKGAIDPLLTSFLERQIDRAVANGAEIIIFDIESPGGLLYQSRDLAFKIAGLEDQGIRTIAYVPKEALSGAAIISLGCDEIYMTHRATFGSAGVIALNGHLDDVERAKAESVLREWVRDLAERKNRPVALALGMVDMKQHAYEVTNKATGKKWYMTEEEIHDANDEWIQGNMVPETGEGLLVTFSGNRGHELQMTERPVADFEELKERIGIPEDIQPQLVARTWLDDTVFVLNTNFVTGLLLFVGIICIYLELHFMSGILGIISVLCFGLFFWSKFLGGTAGWLEVLLFALGIGCLAMEVFVMPGFGVFGVSGALLLFAALVMASQTFTSFDRSQDFSKATETMATLSTSIIAVIVMAMALSKFLPRIPFLNRMILTPPGMETVPSPHDPQLRPDLADSGTLSSLVGQQGETLTVLRPAGKARVAGRLLDVVSDGPYIPQGSAIEVLQINGNRIVVREA